MASAGTGARQQPQTVQPKTTSYYNAGGCSVFVNTRSQRRINAAPYFDTTLLWQHWCRSRRATFYNFRTNKQSYVVKQLHFNVTLDITTLVSRDSQYFRCWWQLIPKGSFNRVTQTAFFSLSFSNQFRFLFVMADMLWSKCFYPAITVCSLFVILCCLCILRPMRERLLGAGIKMNISDVSLHNPLGIFLYIWTTNVYSTTWWK